MATKSGFELAYSRGDGGYRVRNMKGTHMGIVVPLADGKGWLILGDATHRAWPTEDDAAEEILAVCEALEVCSDYWSHYDVPLGLVDDLKAALAKARGES